MIKSSVFKNIISNLSDAVVLVRPVFHNDEISDFSVLYSNNQFAKMIKSRKNQDMNLSSLFEILSPNVDFVSVGKSSYSSNQEISQEFYSPELNMWLKVNVSEIDILARYRKGVKVFDLKGASSSGTKIICAGTFKEDDDIVVVNETEEYSAVSISSIPEDTRASKGRALSVEQSTTLTYAAVKHNS